MSVLDEDIDRSISADDDDALVEIQSAALSVPLNGSKNLLNFKGALLRKIFANEHEKVGIIGARSRIGQAAQAAATVAIPGNLSTVRSPVRSTVYSAITPGGEESGAGRALGLLRRAKPKRGPLRCPVGYEFGGRFASRNFANCGRQLFDLPGGLGAGIGSGRGIGLLGLLKREGRDVRFGAYEGTPVQIQRAAQIARVGASNNAQRAKSVETAIAALSDPTISGGLLVRRDGSTLRTKVANNVLGTIRENPDMEDGSLIFAAKSPSEIGDEGAASIWIGNTKSVSYVLPGGGSITVQRKGKLSNGQKRILTRAWTASATQDFGKNNYGARLRDVVEKSDGTLTYAEKFPNIDKPNDLVTVEEIGNAKNKTSVQRWVFETFMSESAPGRGRNKPYKEVGKKSTSKTPVAAGEITSVSEAVEHLDGNGSPEEVPSEFLGQALSKSKVFRSSKIRKGVTLFERGDEQSWYRNESTGDYAHLAERVSADIHDSLGLRSAPVTFIGQGSRRDYLVASPQNESQGTIFSAPISEMSPEDLLRMSVSDYLLDQRDRNPSNMRLAKIGEENDLVLGGGNLSALAGLSKDELEKRRAMVLEDYLRENRIGQVAKKFNELSAAQRKAMLDVYNDLVKRASEFNWDDYSARLGIDGQLSAAEKAHLELIRAIYDRRLETLRSAKKRYLQAIGVQ